MWVGKAVLSHTFVVLNHMRDLVAVVSQKSQKLENPPALQRVNTGHIFQVLGNRNVRAQVNVSMFYP